MVDTSKRGGVLCQCTHRNHHTHIVREQSILHAHRALAHQMNCPAQFYHLAEARSKHLVRWWTKGISRVVVAVVAFGKSAKIYG